MSRHIRDIYTGPIYVRSIYKPLHLLKWPYCTVRYDHEKEFYHVSTKHGHCPISLNREIVRDPVRLFSTQHCLIEWTLSRRARCHIQFCITNPRTLWACTQPQVEKSPICSMTGLIKSDKNSHSSDKFQKMFESNFCPNNNAWIIIVSWILTIF